MIPQHCMFDVAVQRHHRKLIELLARLSLKFGDFTLASGRKSDHYLDCRTASLDSEGARLIATLIRAFWSDIGHDTYGGMSIGADPIIGALLATSETGRHHGLLVRKEAKQHGTGKLVEGTLRPGMRVLVIEDVTTTGSSAIQAMERIAEACRKMSTAEQPQIVGVTSVVDRQEDAAEKFARLGIPFRPLVSLSRVVEQARPAT